MLGLRARGRGTVLAALLDVDLAGGCMGVQYLQVARDDARLCRGQSLSRIRGGPGLYRVIEGDSSKRIKGRGESELSSCGKRR